MRKKKVIGVIGGGQLGRMFIEEALHFDVECIIVDADKDCPAAAIAAHHIVGSIAEAEPIHKLAEVADVLTYEIEHIFIEPLLQLEEEGKVKLIPSPKILQMVQDKGLQKKFYLENHIPTAPFLIAKHTGEWKGIIESFGWKRFVAKSCREGYDGRGVKIMSAEDLKDTSTIPFKNETVLEAFVECEKELSVIVACDQDGNMSFFPPVEMEFDPEANLVTYLFAPAQISEAVKKKAEAIAEQLVQALNSPGLFAVEMFLDKEQNIFVNEMAPRPHNSGHHTIEACYTSQYEQLLRILLHLPMGSTELIKPAAMINILGGKDFSGSYYLHGFDELVKIPGVHVHLYGKKESRPMRKLGHITVLADSVEQVKKKARDIQQRFSIRPLSS